MCPSPPPAQTRASVPPVITAPTVHAAAVPAKAPAHPNQLPIPRSAAFFHPTLSPPNGVEIPTFGKSSAAFFHPTLSPPNGVEIPTFGKS